jgi:hypothetical protein
MRVAVVSTAENDIGFHVILGADFLQRTGAVLDFGRGRHSIHADPEGRDPKPPKWVVPRRLRLRPRGWFV